ncbi:hypothetical protein SAMN05445756_1906 [Kytococcus aerolatus]|uniref:DUF559 domain-containing protein n=1 Tax=Kytococcus aerolatus TaxID=592308 RepID=A0A212U4Y6_9MICO|nr:hypothetical protein [Kytococcus aerolatus]SNC73322.1 hypothetical protein SAMN05445756_1906 [Kytococcus aerolatus]
MTQPPAPWYLTGRGRLVPTPHGPTTRDRLRREGAWSPTQGVIVAPHASPPEIVQAVLAVLPAHASVSHLTAARFHRIPLPHPWSREEPIHVSVPPDRSLPRRRGVLAHRDDQLTTVEVGGVRCTSLATTWRQLCSTLREEDLVAATDAVLGRVCPVQGPLDKEALAAAIVPGARGATRARWALALAEAAAASLPETRLRLLVREWGLPQPAVNADVLNEEGEWLATSDLVWKTQRVVAEYEGDHHRTDPAQWHADIERVRLIESAGWVVVRVTRQDLRRPAGLRQALQAALRRGAGPS